MKAEFEPSDRAPATVLPPRRHSGRAILFAGVAGASVLGVGLGLWARPSTHDRPGVAAESREAAPAGPIASRKLEVVVADRAPVPPTASAASAPIEVLPTAAHDVAKPAPRLFPDLFAPRRAPDALIRAEAPAPPVAAPPHAERSSPLQGLGPALAGAFSTARLIMTRLETPSTPSTPSAREPEAAAPGREPQSEPRRIERHRAEAEVVAARIVAERKAERARAAQAHRAELARRAEAAHAQALARADALAAEREARAERAEQLRLAKAQREHKAELARAEAAKAATHRLALARAEQAEKAETLRLAKAQARAKAAAREEARMEALADAAEAKKRAQLVRLAKAVAAGVQRHLRAPPEPVQVAREDRRHGRKALHEPRVEQASLKAKRGHAPPRVAIPPRPQRARPEPLAPQPGSGLMRVSTNPRCASHDAGEAMVCADPSLGAAERQVARAYQGARAAGVPDAQLRQQQQRWLAARSAAAREAPWAVRDVYMARIAELNGQAKEAQGGPN